MDRDPMMAVVIMGIACTVVLLGWCVAVALVVVFVQRRVRRMEAEHGGPLPAAPDGALLFYALGVFFWPAAFVAGVHFLREARSARQGRNCVIIGLLDISVIVVLTCAAMVVLAYKLPHLLH